MVGSLTCQRESFGVHSRCHRDVGSYSCLTCGVVNDQAIFVSYGVLCYLWGYLWVRGVASLVRRWRVWNFTELEMACNRYRDLCATIFSKYPEVFPTEVIQIYLAFAYCLSNSLHLVYFLFCFQERQWFIHYVAATLVHCWLETWSFNICQVISPGLFLGHIQMGVWDTLLPTCKLSLPCTKIIQIPLQLRACCHSLTAFWGRFWKCALGFLICGFF